MKTPILLLLALFVCEQLFGQTRLRKLPNNINLPAVNNFAPFISLDGNTLVYVSDYAEDKIPTMYITTKVDAVNWKAPMIMPKHVNNRLNFTKGFGLGADGKTLFISSLKDGGWGGFDLYSCAAKGNGWMEPVNMGTSINSPANEACISVSADEQMLFFMRCTKMSANAAEGCKILMVKKKPNGQWDKAIELPPTINTGNSQAPRILGDGETLIFSSNMLTPNKGGMDLYMTRLDGNDWSTPLALEFANTPADDLFASANSIARTLVKDFVTGQKSELVEVTFPPELKPKAVMRIDGKISGPANLASPFITVFNLKDQSKIFSDRPRDDGSFTLFLKSGARYELSLEPEQDNYTFYTRTFDLTEEKFPVFESVEAILKPIAKGDEIELPGISFIPHGIEITQTSRQELRRLTRLLKGNPTLKFNLDVTLNGYLKDSLQSSADLTEIVHDTIHITVTDTVRISVAPPSEYDSTGFAPDSVKSNVTSLSDDKILTTPSDSIQIVHRDSIVVKTTYHNDRTEQQAMAVVYYLVSQGIAADQLTHSHHTNEEAVIEKRKTKVTLSVRP